MKKTFRGKITCIDNDYVTVCLFYEGEEIYGELHRIEFPKELLYTGCIFLYVVESDGNGHTTIDITPWKNIDIV